MNRYFFLLFIIIFFHGSFSNAAVEGQLIIAGTGDSQEVVRQLAGRIPIFRVDWVTL